MIAVILAGGMGTRLAEETAVRPKPMVEIGGKPILWHIMKIYSYYGVNDFIICCGYKGLMIKEYFSNYALYMSDVTIDFKSNKLNVHHKRAEPWTVTLVDTGENSMTGGRLLRVRDHLEDENDFCLTYGDGLSDVDIRAAIEFHKCHGKIATLTAAVPPSRFGVLELLGDKVTNFVEKPSFGNEMINGGYFVLNKRILDYLHDDQTVFENDPLTRLAVEGQLMAFIHKGFWQPMDTLRDKNFLENLWSNGKAPWKVWC